MPEMAGLNTQNPLLNQDGTPALTPDWPLVRIDRAAPTGSVLASDGPRRETRRTHDRVVRAYRITVFPARAAECERVRQAIMRTRGGANWTRWRHPVDDAPGSVDTAPRWRVLNAGVDGEFTLTRGAGGLGARLEIVLEEV